MFYASDRFFFYFEYLKSDILKFKERYWVIFVNLELNTHKDLVKILSYVRFNL